MKIVSAEIPRFFNIFPFQNGKTISKIEYLISPRMPSSVRCWG
jgi:hypothetical protein